MKIRTICHRTICHAAILLILLSVFFSFCGCSLLYDITTIDTDWGSMAIGYSNVLRQSFAGPMTCNTQSIKITVPDEYDGMKITGLGGYFGRGVPTPFSICRVIESEGDYESSYGCDLEFAINLPAPEGGSKQYFTYEYVLVLGKNIKTVYAGMGADARETEDSVSFHIPYVYVEIDQENKYFYAKDGVLYERSTDEKVDGFIYASDLTGIVSD